MLPYYISEFGHVYNKRGRRMKPRMKKTGYLDIGLFVHKHKIYPQIHVLVASTYIPNPDNLPVVNHIDGNKLNNHVSNLEWVTYSQNTQHAFATGLMTPQYGEKNGMALFTNKEVEHICELLQDGMEIDDVCREVGLDPHNPSDFHRIWAIKSGKRWSSISCNYTFPDKSQTNRFAEIHLSPERQQLIHSICKEIEKSPPDTKISDIAKQLGLEYNSKTYDLIYDIKKRNKYKSISRRYVW